MQLLKVIIFQFVLVCTVDLCRGKMLSNCEVCSKQCEKAFPGKEMTGHIPLGTHTCVCTDSEDQNVFHAHGMIDGEQYLDEDLTFIPMCTYEIVGKTTCSPTVMDKIAFSES